jgi:hypothetical protein
MLPLMLERKYVAVKLCYPLPAFHNQFEMLYRTPDVWFHFAPEESRVSLSQVGGADITQPLINSDLSELMEECIDG